MALREHQSICDVCDDVKVVKRQRFIMSDRSSPKRFKVSVTDRFSHFHLEMNLRSFHGRTHGEVGELVDFEN
ncbi:hypothetical protein QJS10_CPA05g02473 [Acorus calamus]|uniref:Uncharacterized protein n=1 Tax=Acorus calamus TaxID=4465 RepID=A0AAV9EY98_ACOCL|nr:hypothetical protein QJS10_CPA05g02473 [Acorus calamus]